MTFAPRRLSRAAAICLLLAACKQASQGNPGNHDGGAMTGADAGGGAGSGGAMSSSADRTACDLLAAGPGESIDIGGVSIPDGDAPVVTTGQRYDIRMNNAIDWGQGGYLKFEAPRRGEYIVFVDNALGVTVEPWNNDDRRADQSSSVIPGCPALNARHIFRLPAGKYVFTVGPTLAAQIRLLILPGADSFPQPAPDIAAANGLLPDGSHVRSGTRVKVSWFVAQDGVRVPDGWYDTRVGASCAFGPVHDGSWRCIPFGTFVGLLGPDTPTPFADDACSKPVLPVRGQLGSIRAGTMVWVPLPRSCPAVGGVFQAVGEPVLDQAVFHSDGVSCRPGDLPSDGFFRTKEVSDSFVSGRRSEGAAQGGLAPLYYDTDDGARGFAGWKDVGRGVACDPSVESSAGERICLPFERTVRLDPSRPSFTDAMCKQPAAAVASGWGCSDGFVYRERAGCAETAHVFALGPRRDVGYRGSGSSCAPVEVGAVFAAGAEIPLAAFPALRLEPGTTGARLRPLFVAGPAGKAPVAREMWDAVLGTPCIFEDGLCLPRGAHHPNAIYIDAACTRKGYYVESGCDAGSPFAVTHEGGERVPSSDPVLTRLWRILGRRPGQAFRPDGTDCVADPFPQQPLVLELEEIPIATLPSIRGRTDE